MPTISAALRTTQAADFVKNFDTLDIIDGDGSTVLVTYSITWGAGAAGVQEVQAVPMDATASNTGTATTAVFRDSGASGEELTGVPVATSGQPVTIDNTSIESGQVVQLTSCTITAPTDIT